MKKSIKFKTTLKKFFEKNLKKSMLIILKYVEKRKKGPNFLKK